MSTNPLRFDTVLIANRGEIACRIIATAQQMGLRTVAVYSDADADARHVRNADTAVHLGAAAPAESYLAIDKILAAAKSTGAGAIHPGYGFLSENAAFATRIEDAGLAFVGPTPHHLRVFGDKHTAREAARGVGLPLVPGTGLLHDADHAVAEADTIGFPVMVKAVGGGGGIGLQICRDADEVRDAFERVQRLSGNHFGSAGVFLERYVGRARHVEVQLFGDGRGAVVPLGTRDCSLQRRNQKVIEEAPAPNLPTDLSEALIDGSLALARSVNYRSAGTVEFVYDTDRGEASFLEMNTRLQVEHPVTEAVTSIDLVEWMLRTAGGDTRLLTPYTAAPPAITGHAVEARIYAEDPSADYRPSPGLLTTVTFPTDVRVDTWVESGSEATAFYDPLLAKVIVAGADRAEAIGALRRAVAQSCIHGVVTNLGQVAEALDSDEFGCATHTTTTLDGIRGNRGRIDVLRAGTSTTMQDLPGRIGLWNVGIPPSGPMDDRSFQAANLAVGNPAGTTALECTLTGPRLRFADAVRVAVAGAPARVRVDGVAIDMGVAASVPAGGVLEIDAPDDAGLRTYLAIAGGFAAPDYLGSTATFALGGFGGVSGRELRDGDVLSVGVTPTTDERPSAVAVPCTHAWRLAVTPGPQASADYFTAADLEQLYTHDWRVGGHANRTGVRLEGPAPQWSRSDGGDAGLHPSNLHDNPYSVGALNISGDTPILLGPDGPSLGGFVCPVTVVSGDRWKLGQLRPGDTVRFDPVSDEVATLLRRASPGAAATRSSGPDDGLLARLAATRGRPEVRYQRAGDDNLLIEYGDMSLDLLLRMRVHALSNALSDTGISGIVDATPGVRTLHLHVDPDTIEMTGLIDTLIGLEETIGSSAELTVPSRRIRLPLSFDDPSIAEAMDRYRTGVREHAPWLPSNIEFIRRINGLDSVDEVRDIVFDSENLVLGLGDVYLGAPLAVPLDPRHRLVTTKYNPARTWTPSDAVGIGGKYLCIYGMASPGGYQLIGRTLPIWSTHARNPAFRDGKPWLFRYFDRLVWEPVTATELVDIRTAARSGHFVPEISDGTFAIADHLKFLADNAADIADVEATRTAAFEAEKRAWRASGEFDREPSPIAPDRPTPEIEIPPGATLVRSPMAGSVWRVEARPGDRLRDGATIAVLEAMKLELPVTTNQSGVVLKTFVTPGTQVGPGSPLALIGAP